MLVVIGVFAVGAAPAGAALLSDADRAAYAKAFAAAEEKDWEAAFAAADRATSPLLRDVIAWKRYQQRHLDVAFTDIAAFVESHPHWPMLWTLAKRAEEAMTVDEDPEAVLRWYLDREPITADGWIAYVRALFAAGRRAEGRTAARRAWIEANFGATQQRAFYDAHRRHLTPEDHIRRLDRLLWDGHRYAPRRMFPLVPEGWRRLGQARIALRHMEGGVDVAIERVPESLRGDPGLVYERLRWRRVKDRFEDAVALLDHPAADGDRPALWWRERAILTREALQRGHVTRAYAFASNHRLDDGFPLAQAEWMAGWIALRFLNEPALAFDHFKRLHEGVSTPISQARGGYWAGRAAEAMGAIPLAEAWHLKASNHPTTYYGQLAAARLDAAQDWALPSDPMPSDEDMARFDDRELVTIVRMLDELGLPEETRPFLIHLGDEAKTAGEGALVASLAAHVGRPDLGVTVARRVAQDGTLLITTGYPAHRFALPDQPERALVMALIRQESGFDERAISRAGARGLMQVMPRTARGLARELRITNHATDRLTLDPSYNVQLGTHYLNGLLERYGGSYILAVAAYNAGPSRIDRWIREYGDPRTPGVDPVDWIEMIPFYETRNYVQRVLEGTQVYRRRMGSTTTIAMDLERDLRR